MKKLLTLLTLFSVVLLCGCTGYREIDRGYIVTAIGFAQSDNNITVFLETISSSDVTESGSARLVLKGGGKTPHDALENIKTQLIKPLYFEQLGAVVFENRIDTTNKTQIINLLKNNSSISWGVNFVNTPDAATLFDTETQNKILGYDIIGIIKNFEKANSLSLSNQFFKQNRLPSALPVVSISDGNLILEAG